MSEKDDILEGKIAEAAAEEFMDKGFRDASMRQIAKRAGLTTGALYSHYDNKDVLFCSVVGSALEAIRSEFAPIQQIHEAARSAGDPEQIIEAVRKEGQIYLDILFRHYDQCMLLFCRSDGSSLQGTLELLTAEKARQTAALLKPLIKKEADFDGLEFIFSEQFRFYRKVLEEGCTKEKAASCLETIGTCVEAGLRELFQLKRGALLTGFRRGRQ